MQVATMNAIGEGNCSNTDSASMKFSEANDFQVDQSDLI